MREVRAHEFLGWRCPPFEGEHVDPLGRWMDDGLQPQAMRTGRCRRPLVFVAEPPTLSSAIPNWQIGDKIPFGPGKPPLLVVGIPATVSRRQDFEAFGRLHPIRQPRQAGQGIRHSVRRPGAVRNDARGTRVPLEPAE